ncbi:MAG TPA: (2Fe-2S)-binding protein [Nitrospirota bacterium]|nr:(2Fe-2S)-binding protein [Nitrospirota bacterium]
MINLNINGKTYQVDASPDTPLLWVIREHMKLTGTKYGCGVAMCGACTVHIEGEATRSCQVPVKDAVGKKIMTIEAVGTTQAGRAVQEAWVAEDVPQCGYCQSGHIMAAAALLSANPKPSEGDIDSAMNGNLCRCGTYQRIRRAVHRAADMLAKGGRP